MRVNLLLVGLVAWVVLLPETSLCSLGIRQDGDPWFFERDWEDISSAVLGEVIDSGFGIAEQGELKTSHEAATEVSRLINEEEYSKAFDEYDFKVWFKVRILEDYMEPSRVGQTIDIRIEDSYDRMMKYLGNRPKPEDRFVFFKYEKNFVWPYVTPAPGWVWFEGGLASEIRKERGLEDQPKSEESE